MNKSELIKEVALKGQLSFNEATNAVDAIMETIAETMHKGESVTLVGFEQIRRFLQFLALQMEPHILHRN